MDPVTLMSMMSAFGGMSGGSGGEGTGNPYIPVGSAALGLLQTIQGFSGLNKQGPTPKFSEDPAMAKSRQRAERLARGGYTPQERAAFESNIQRRYNTADRKIKDTAGGLGSYVAGVTGANRSAADLQFAASDAALQRENIRYADRFAENLQRISEKNTEVALQERNQAIASYGQAAQSGLTNLAESVNTYSATGGFEGGGGANRAPGGGVTSGAPVPGAMSSAVNRAAAPTPQVGGSGLDYSPPSSISDVRGAGNGLNTSNSMFGDYQFPDITGPMDLGFGPVNTNVPIMATNFGFNNPFE